MTLKNTIIILLLLISVLPIFSQVDSTYKLLYINSEGKVGLGTNEPQSKLDVRGDINITGSILVNGEYGDSSYVLTSNGVKESAIWTKKSWQEDSLKVFNSDKKIEVNKTFINNAYYSDEPYTYFNEWYSNKQSIIDLPPFSFTGGEFPNTNNPGTPNNYTYNLGFNVNPGGGIKKNGFASTALSFESRYYIDGDPYTEFHIIAVDTFGVQRRPLSTISAYDGTRNDWSNFVSVMNLHNINGDKQIYTINTETEEWNYNGIGLKHLFRKPNYIPFWQTVNDGNNNVRPLIGYLGDSLNNIRLQLGNPEGHTNMRLGHGLEIGYNEISNNYIGTALGDGSTNLLIGIEGKRFSTIEFNTIYGDVTKFKNVYNNYGWSIGLNSPGAFYLRDETTQNIPFYISGSMPNNSFFLTSNGNLCLGCQQTNDKLKIEGDLDISGTLKLNGDSGENGSLLVSKGENNQAIWQSIDQLRHEELFILSNGQTTFNITNDLPQPSTIQIPIAVFKNGIKLKYTNQTPAEREYNYNENVITIFPADSGDEIEVVYFK